MLMDEIRAGTREQLGEHRLGPAPGPTLPAMPDPAMNAFEIAQWLDACNRVLAEHFHDRVRLVFN